MNWKPSKKSEQKLDKKLDGNVEQDTKKLAQQNARHYLYPEPCLSETERETLKKILLQTTSTGSHLHRCTDPKQAERFNNYLMHHLPLNFAAGIIRDCEINTFIFQH